MLLGDLILLGYLACRTVIDQAVTPFLAEIGPLVVGAGVLVALITLALNMRRQSSEDYLESASELIEKAYNILAQLDDKGRPKNIRLNWLTAARCLITSENISKLVAVKSHKKIYRERREYWQARFYDLINPSGEGFPEDYYADSPKNMIMSSEEEREPLDESSLAVMYRFVLWPKGFEDPLKNEPKFTDKEIDRMERFGPKGLGRLIKKVRQL